ncbi:MAG TPA: DUF1800 domain-containing protein [Pirellulales bacterium]|nr:DUF1800 domain-containing protein [Pirellulales bacterium]
MAADPLSPLTPLAEIDPAWAWSPFPSDAKLWTRELAAHLYRRGGFGGAWAEIDEAVADGCPGAVERLIAHAPASDSFYGDADRSVTALLASGNANNLPAWWLYVMLQTPQPLLEKLTLFWHGHFATSAAKVTDGRMMFAQHALLRKHALGRFGPMLDELSKDPAMLVWLDATTNHKARPNENFAREVMELFCLGIGNYTEHDIKEAARAFTGWELRQDAFRFNRHQHDGGEKTVLGRSGRFVGDDVLQILLEQPATARFLVRKLFRFLVNETAEAPDALLEPLAAGFRASDYDMTWLLRTMLRSNFFYSPHAVRQRVKSPVEFAIGLLRMLQGSANTYALADDLRDLGQAVFFPPNVKGWDGGAAWINSSTLVGRANLVWKLASDSDGRYKTHLALDRLPALDGLKEPAAISRRIADLLLAAPLPDAVYVQLAAVAGDSAMANQPARLARIVQAVATLPEFQLA